MTKEEGNKIKEAIARTTIPEEMSTLYLLANATDMMVHNTYRRMKSVYATHGYELKDNGMLSGLHDYCETVRRAITFFQERIEPYIISATFGTPEAGQKGNVQGYDGFQDDAREIIKLILLYVDRTARNNSACEAVFKNLIGIPSGGIFTEADINKYGR